MRVTRANPLEKPGKDRLIIAFDSRIAIWDELDEDQTGTIRALVQALQRNSSVKCLSLLEMISMSCFVIHSPCQYEFGGPKSTKRGDIHWADELLRGNLHDALSKNSVLQSLALHSPEKVYTAREQRSRLFVNHLLENPTLCDIEHHLHEVRDGSTLSADLERK